MFYREIKKRKFWLLSFVEVPGAEPVPITEPGAEPVPITELLSLTETKDNNQNTAEQETEKRKKRKSVIGA